MDRSDTRGEAVTSPAELRRMRARFERRAEERQALLAKRLCQARADFERIVDHVWATYRPRRIWQWGSLIDDGHFSERSDKPVIADETQRLLHELRRFRHFKRYYYEMDYDWARLDYLCDVYRRVLPLVRRDLDRFRGFLQRTLQC